LVTATRSCELEALVARLEAQYEAHTERLSYLVARRGSRSSAVYHLAEIAAARQALAETARLLQRTTERDFGACLACARELPLEVLLVQPELRACPGCEDVVPPPDAVSA